MKKKKILIATGGTGGHVLPALAFADECLEKFEGIDFHFVGGKLSTNRFFKQRYPFSEVACGKFSKNPFILFFELLSILIGVYQSLKLMLKYRPDLIIGFGSFYTFPILMAAILAKCPLFLHESNAIPGKVTRLFSGRAHLTALQFKEAEKYLSGISKPVIMPLKREMRLETYSQEECRNYFKLEANLFTILIFGGSQGAKFINQLFVRAVPLLKKELPPFQVIHLAGTEEETLFLKQQYEKNNIPGAVKSYENEMVKAWKCADLVISRSGASTIAEQLHFSVPGIFIPYPFSKDNHQEVNANLVQALGGSLTLIEKNLTPEIFSQCLADVFHHLAEMRRNLKEYGHLCQLPNFTDLTWQFLKERKP